MATAVNARAKAPDLLIAGLPRDSPASRAMRRRQLKKLWARLKELATRDHPRDALLIKLGQAKEQSPSAWRLVDIHVEADGALRYQLNRKKLKETTLREGRYLLRSNLTEEEFGTFLDTYNLPDPDLIIRTGGEQRLSGYLSWQSQYSELYFTDVLMPDFDEKEFAKALEDYAQRQRRFGK